MTRRKFLSISIFLFTSFAAVLLSTYLYKKNTSVDKKEITFSRQLENGDYFIKDQGEWKNIKDVDFANVDENSLLGIRASNVGGKDQHILTHLIRGYFLNYDEKKENLTIRTPFINSSIYYDVIIKASPSEIIYCWPEQIRDVSIKNLYFDLKNPPIISLPEEKKVIFSSLIPKINDETFFIIQLSNSLDENDVNDPVKIAIICEDL